MKKIFLLSVFSVLAFTLSFLPQDAHATTVYTLDQTTCQSILYPGSWDAATNTCLLTGVVNFGTNNGPHVLELFIPSGNTLTISSTSGFFFDFDTITNNGTISLVNQGGLAVTNGGVLNNNGILDNNAPYLQNGAGTINNNVGATINNNGRFTNYFATINNRGVLNAGSDLENQAGGTINNICPGVINGGIIGTQPVNSCPQSTTTTILSSVNPSTFGQSVTFTATISPNSATGTVTFKDGSTTLGTGTISSGTATYSTSSLSAGPHTITASYSGSGSNPASTSSPLTQTVNQVSSTTTISSSVNPSTFGQSVTFTATISPTPDGGTVQFQANGTNLGSPVTVSGTTASTNTSSLAVGHYSIIGIYSGTTSLATSTGVFSQTVNQIICSAGSFLSGNSCVPAPPGSYVPLPGAASATLCPVGQYQPLAGQTSCNPADPGNFVNGIGSTSETLCLVGTFQPNAGSTSCIPAPAGSFVGVTGATSADLCTVGTFTDIIGQPVCTLAPAGSFVNQTGSTSANLCPVGTFTAITGQSSCTPAPAGSFVDVAGATSSQLCQIGTFTDITGQAQCFPAPAGSFVNSTGATFSQLCLPGTFTAIIGQSSCTPSPAGSFATGPGATYSTLCVPGSYQPSTGQPTCLLADPGFYVSSSGAIQQTQCPVGYSSNAGATSCFVVDVTSPTISIIQPSDGSVLDHISSINGTASDDTLVSSVMVSVDGGSPQAAVYSSGTWTITTTLSTGTHTANATATDEIGHKTSTGITHFAILASTQGRVTGGGHIGQDQNFGFEVKSDDDHKKSSSGHIEYHNKSKKIDLDSKKITALSVYDSSTRAAFLGQGQIHDKDKTLYSFFVQVYDSDKSGDHDTFSITITDSGGGIIYQNSGIVHGHIEIHKFADKDDKSDSGVNHDDHK